MVTTFNTDAWLAPLLSRDADIEIKKLSPMVLERIITLYDGKRIATLCRTRLAELKSKLSQLEQGVLPDPRSLRLESTQEPTERIVTAWEEILQGKPIPWLYALELEPQEKFRAACGKIPGLFLGIQRRIRHLIAEDENLSRTIFALFSPSEPFTGERAKLRKVVLSTCAMVLQKNGGGDWLTWGAIARAWMNAPKKSQEPGKPPELATSAEARTHAMNVYAALGTFTPDDRVEFSPLRDQTTPFKTYVIGLSIHKILVENLKLSGLEEIKLALASYFSEHDSARKYALYYTLQLALKGVLPQQTPQSVTGTLASLVEASNLLFTIKTPDEDRDMRSAYFELFFHSSQAGRDLFREISPTYSTFKQAYDVIKAYFVDIKSLNSFLDAAKHILGSLANFSFARFHELFQKKSAWARARFAQAHPVKRMLLVLHEMAGRPSPPFDRITIEEVTAPLPDEAAYVDAWLAIRSEATDVLTFDEHLEFLTRFEALLGHELPAKVIYSALFAQNVPKALFDVPIAYAKIREKIQDLPPTRGGIPLAIIKEITELESSLDEQCRIALSHERQCLIDAEARYGVRLALFARLAQTRLHREYSHTAYGLQDFFPQTLPFGAEKSEEERARQNRDFFSIERYPSHSRGFRYRWQESPTGFIYRLEIFSKIKETQFLIDVPLDISRQDLESDTVRTKLVHWIIRLLSHESSWYEEMAPREHVEYLLHNLKEEKLELPSEEVWPFVDKAYTFAKELTIKVRILLCGA